MCVMSVGEGSSWICKANPATVICGLSRGGSEQRKWAGSEPALVVTPWFISRGVWGRGRETLLVASFTSAQL